MFRQPAAKSAPAPVPSNPIRHCITQPPIQLVVRAISPGVKRPGHEASHSPPFIAEVKEVDLQLCYLVHFYDLRRENLVLPPCLLYIIEVKYVFGFSVVTFSVKAFSISECGSPFVVR